MRHIVFTAIITISFLTTFAQKHDSVKDTFDKIKALVIPKSTYVNVGSEYEAEVILVNINSKSRNPVFVNGRPLPMRDGKGIYTSRPSMMGVYNWGGKIEVKDGDNTFSYPFSAEYIAMNMGASISADVMNLLYIGLDNPISISVAGFAQEDLLVNITNGNLSKNEHGYIAKVFNKGQATISVSVKMKDGSVRMMGTKSFRVKEIPKPESMFGAMESGNYSDTSLLGQNFIVAKMSNFTFERMNWVVVKYSCSYFPQESKPEFLSVKGSEITVQIKEVISKAKNGDKIIIDEIIAQGPNGEVKLAPIVLTIQD